MLLYIFIGISSILSILYIERLVFSNKLKRKNSELKLALEGELIKIKNRTGFYDGSYNYGNKSTKYSYRVYVTELEKYENGFSKLKYDGCTVSGPDFNIYSTIEKYCEKDFLDIREIKDITWLEKEKDIAELRKDKLERILNEN